MALIILPFAPNSICYNACMRKGILIFGTPRLRVLAANTLLFAILALPGLADEYSLPDWSTSHVSSAMCEGSKMHLVATGVVAVAFERTYLVLMDTNVLERVEAAYCRELPAGAKTNLMVTPLDTNGHYTVNWKDEQADVRDVWRGTDTNSYFEGGYVITGKRFFGSFETVMAVRVERTETGQARFRADVLVYPHNGLIRFLFSNVLSVEDYFRATMIEMSAEIKRVCTSLCQSNNAPATATAPVVGK